MKRVLLALLALPLYAGAQAANPSIVAVVNAPSGGCGNGLPDEQVVSTGVLYSCQAGTWAIIGGGSTTPGTTTNPLTGAASGGAAPGSTFNGSAAVTFDYHTLGAVPLNGGVAMTGPLYTPSVVTGNPSNPQVTVGPSTTPPFAWTFDLTTPITALNSLSSPSECLQAAQISNQCFAGAWQFTGLGTTGTTGTIVIYSSSSTFTGSIAGNILTAGTPSGGFGIALGQTIAGTGITSATIIGYGDTATVGQAGTYIISGAPQTVGSETITGSGASAPANSMFSVCPYVAIKTAGSGGNIEYQLTATTPGGRVFSGTNQIGTTGSGTNTSFTCATVSVGSGTNFSFDIAASSLTGSPVWETEPVVYRIR